MRGVASAVPSCLASRAARVSAHLMRYLLLALFLATLGAAADAISGPPVTVAEASGFRATGRYDEVVALCAAFQHAYPKAARCKEFGRTPEGRPMLALVVSRTGALDAAAARRRDVPVVLIQGGIHAGEIDGKDAGFLALREALEDRGPSAPLRKLVVVFVPVFNVDGHERYGRWNRPNQRGPEAMGWRTTAQNYNLNRDYVKADAPEMQAMLRLVDAWDPLACIDLHVTDGAQFEHDVSIQVEPTRAGDLALREAGAALRDGVIADLAAQGSLPLPFYMEFAVPGDPSSGFVDGVAPPRFSHGYFQLRNRFGMLVETHSWKDYRTRVRVTRNAIDAVLAQVARNGTALRIAVREADARASGLSGTPVPLAYKVAATSRIIQFRGYEYTRTPSDVSGALMTRYDESRPQIWNVPLRDDVQPEIVVMAPLAGYLVPAAHASQVARKLRLHGIAYRLLPRGLASAEVEVFRATKVAFGERSTEGHQRLQLDGNWSIERRDFAAGTLYVPTAQPKARLVMALLEPQAPDSLVAWGEFNTAFEPKEYMEDYVAEDVAREQLAATPDLAIEFRGRIVADPAFAQSTAARLEFFARRHPSWDERYNLYPVARTAVPPS